MNPSLADELLALAAADDATRTRLAADGSLFDGYHPEMEAVHRRNAMVLSSIVDRHGWPSCSLVGEASASAAWRILHHAIGEPGFVRRLLPILREATRRGDASPAELATIEDRIRVYEGRPQLYGTQLDWNADATAFVPMVGVEDPDHVDARREAVGLPPIRWSVAPHAGEAPPADPAARTRAYEAWTRRVGWRG